ncbi:hypothetical protein F53441_8458 [Fusarium austroafricanum]|uniref:Uncharacterized protein n=1 Tax=Fusarium austroafricanum TaxID=2364996 RepID=A0A8H4NXB9_9HYPO|nr:hypothetical protein F53441_8458 [Fusarium austroafricanum]
MSASKTDLKVASIAMSFTLGFGLLTVWEAWKQTRRNRNPLRSSYIYMLWGEIVANLGIAIIGWLFLDGTIGPTYPVLFFILFFWVFEVQLLMQIIVNRISIIAEHKSEIFRLKWGTAGIITAIEIAVFCIWIPSHTVPPLHHVFVDINEIWDKVSKVLILLVDAYLNWYFLRTVQKRLVDQHNLTKYQPLVSFNAKLMVVSILMDCMLVGRTFTPNQIVYIQFHPVAYMVKLNIEMSMANLITRLAKGENNEDVYHPSLSHSGHAQSNQRTNNDTSWTNQGNNIQLDTRSKVVAGDSDEDLASIRQHGGASIHQRTEFELKIERNPKSNPFREGNALELLAELREDIFFYLHSKAPILSLARASPVMLQTFITSKPQVVQDLLVYDFKDKIIQNAIGIILFQRGSISILEQ